MCAYSHNRHRFTDKDLRVGTTVESPSTLVLGEMLEVWPWTHEDGPAAKIAWENGRVTLAKGNQLLDLIIVETDRKKVMELPETPELEKMANVKNESHQLGEFLEWMQSKGIVLAYWHDGQYWDKLEPLHRTIESLLAEYFEIDLQKVEYERQQLLEAIQNQ